MNTGDGRRVNGPSDAREPAAGDAVEQVQRVVLTVIGAARVVLDTIEGIVADRTHLDDLAARGRGVVSSVLDPLFGGHENPRSDNRASGARNASGARDASGDAAARDDT